ncbi:MAG: dynamin family protein, partial [Coleofasciculus sp. S288]|nr:dynamin family protein [Coleofasciculus sp. S288]
MVYNALKSNVQELQKDVIDLLNQSSSLMDRASRALYSERVSEKYEAFGQEVVEANRNVEKLELMMAIVAPMKAGKSTIINAIVGQEILPSRNAAMTTLPTAIILNAELTEPILKLSQEILSVFQEAVLGLQDKLQKMGSGRMQQKIAQYPHLEKLLQDIQASGEFHIPSRTSGREEVIKVLKELNDIVRLCSLIDPSQDPLGRLMDLPCIEAPFWQPRSVFAGDSPDIEQAEELGNLVLVDTPGPNEAGENLKLAAVVAEQLRKSSIVLIVLDFTQLKTQAAEEIKQEVQKVINLRGKENLYVLVNKVDQRGENDMTSEQVRQFVNAELGIGDAEDTERVFEISAIRAFHAANFQLELQHYPERDISQMKTASGLAKQAFGDMWEVMFKGANLGQMRGACRHIWEKSGFSPFLDKVIEVLMAGAAPRCIKSALSLDRNHLQELQDDLRLRLSAIAKDEEKLRQEVSALETDLYHLELCRNQLMAVDKIRVELYWNLNNTFELLKSEAKVGIQDYFIGEDYERADLIKKTDIKARELLLANINGLELFPQWFSQRIKSKLRYKTPGIIEFSDPNEAEEFAGHAVAYAKQKTETLLAGVREKTHQEIEQVRTWLIEFLETLTKPIIERARTRLNEAFDIDLVLPPPKLEFDKDDMGSVAPHVIGQTRSSTPEDAEQVMKKRTWWHWLWLVPVEVTERIQQNKTEDYYSVSLEELVVQINTAIEASITNINQELTKYLDEDFQQRIDAFFESLDAYLRNYKDNLQQAQAAQKLSLDQKEQLVSELSA